MAKIIAQFTGRGQAAVIHLAQFAPNVFHIEYQQRGVVARHEICGLRRAEAVAERMVYQTAPSGRRHA